MRNWDLLDCRVRFFIDSAVQFLTFVQGQTMKRQSVIRWKIAKKFRKLCVSDGDACKSVSLENFKSQRLLGVLNIIIMCKACRGKLCEGREPTFED